MPIYEYVCRECGHEFERFVRSVAEAERGLCPHCQSRQIAKRFSTFASRSGGVGSGASAAGPSCSGPV